MNEYKEIWEFKLDIHQLKSLSLADLITLQIYAHQRGTGETDNYNIINTAVLNKINKLRAIES